VLILCTEILSILGRGMNHMEHKNTLCAKKCRIFSVWKVKIQKVSTELQMFKPCYLFGKIQEKKRPFVLSVIDSEFSTKYRNKKTRNLESHTLVSLMLRVCKYTNNTREVKCKLFVFIIGCGVWRPSVQREKQVPSYFADKKVKVHPCAGNEALYRQYGP